MKSMLTIGLLAAVVACAGAVTAADARADTRTLRVGNWVPTHHLIPRGILEPWAKAIEAETDGALEFDIMRSALDRPPAYFDLLTGGAVDVAWGVSGHNPGRFTMTQVMDLPFMSPDPWAGSAAAWQTYVRYGDRYKEHDGAKVIGLWVHSEPYINMRTKPIRSLADLKDVKIRVGGNVTGRIIDVLGGVPVQLPPTEAQQAMARGVADGITFPLESIEFFKITPVIRYATQIPGGLYTDTFWFAFNEQVWNQLTAEQRAAVEKHSGMAIALLAGWAWTNGDSWGEAAMQRAGVEFIALPDAEADKMADRLVFLEDQWLEEAGKRGLPGEEILDYARAMVDAYRRDKQVNVP